MNSKVLERNNIGFLNILKGALASVSFSLIFILIFALIIRFFNIPDSWIFPVNQAIKLVSLFVGISIALKDNKQKGFVKGMILAISYFVLSFVIFSILQSKINFSISNLYDFILTTLSGGLIGIIFVNIKR